MLGKERDCSQSTLSKLNHSVAEFCVKILLLNSLTYLNSLGVSRNLLTFEKKTIHFILDQRTTTQTLRGKCVHACTESLSKTKRTFAKN